MHYLFSFLLYSFSFIHTVIFGCNEFGRADFLPGLPVYIGTKCSKCISTFVVLLNPQTYRFIPRCAWHAGPSRQETKNTRATRDYISWKHFMFFSSPFFFRQALNLFLYLFLYVGLFFPMAGDCIFLMVCLVGRWGSAHSEKEKKSPGLSFKHFKKCEQMWICVRCHSQLCQKQLICLHILLHHRHCTLQVNLVHTVSVSIWLGLSPFFIF